VCGVDAASGENKTLFLLCAEDLPRQARDRRGESAQKRGHFLPRRQTHISLPELEKEIYRLDSVANYDTTGDGVGATLLHVSSPPPLPLVLFAELRWFYSRNCAEILSEGLSLVCVYRRWRRRRATPT
jgi:hypothetical protein